MMGEETVAISTAAAAAKPVVVPRLINKAVTSAAREVDPRLLKAIKFAARSSNREVYAASNTLALYMRKQSSQVRYLTLLIIDELFMRSKLFRSLLIDKLDEFLIFSIGFKRDLPLPPPSSVATALRTKSIEILEKWNDSFGIYYRKLRLGCDYLKKTLRFQFPNRLENETRLQRERREKELRTKQIFLDKFDRLRDNYSSIMTEIRSTIGEIGECLDLLHFEDGPIPDIVLDDSEVEEVRSFELHQIRLESLREGEKVHENSDNKAIFDALRESQRLLVSKHVPSLKEWMSVLLKVDLDDNQHRDTDADNKFRDMALKEFIDIRNLVKSVEDRCIKLGCALDENPQHEEEEDFWEEGEIEINMPEDSSAPKSSVEESAVNPTTIKGKELARPDNKKPMEGPGTSSTPERSILLSEAPVVVWSSFMDSWGSSRDVLANQRGLELDGHWGRVDYDAVIPAEKIAEINLHCTVYREEPIEIRPCLAPLKKGGLCQRRDLKVCPFHGPIMPRDSEGNLIEQNVHVGESEKQSSTQAEEPLAQTTDHANELLDSENSTDSVKVMVEKLAKQAVNNVREKDRQMKSLKRARLAKIREHNKEVLKEAALVSTSYSEHSTELHEQSTSVQEKCKPESKLRKKETTKDRIAQKLLNNRVTDATVRQLIQGEHSRYREAFANQWS